MGEVSWSEVGFGAELRQALCVTPRTVLKAVHRTPHVKVGPMEEGETTDRDSELRGQVQSRASEVEALIKRGQLKPALLKALQSPPVLARDRSIKDVHAATVQSVVVAIPEAQIDGMLDDMPDEGYDVLMKYLYRLLAASYPSVPGQQPLSGLLLKWHEKLACKTGPGSIVRALTDRKTV